MATNPSFGIQDIPLGEGNYREAHDQLEVTPYVEALTQFITGCATPMTIAVQGDWGTGKTSLMHLIEQRLKADSPRAISLWFNTWQYSQFGMDDAIALAFVHGVSEAISPPGFGDQAVRAAANLFANALPFVMRTAIAVGTAGISQAVAGSGDGSVTPALGSRTSPDALTAINQIARLKNDLEKAVQERCEKDGKERIVIFVDDLDRINPKRAVELLESIKMFMDINKLVFVLALDYAVVKRGIKSRFDTDDASAELGGRSFFDKIIQLPFSMPTANYEVEGYIKHLLEQIELEFDPNDLSIYAKLMKESVGFNPRGAKRLANVMKIYTLVEKARNVQIAENGDNQQRARIKTRVLFGVVCLQLAYEPAFHYLRENLSADTLEKLCQSTDLLKPRYEQLGMVKDFERHSDHLVDFFTALYATVDIDESDCIERQEIDILQGVLANLAITSLEDNATLDFPETPVEYFRIGEMSVAEVRALKGKKRSAVMDAMRFYSCLKTEQMIAKFVRESPDTLHMRDWPKYSKIHSKDVLAGVTIKEAKDYGLQTLVANVLGITAGSDQEIDFNKVFTLHGGKLLKTAFANYWNNV